MSINQANFPSSVWDGTSVARASRDIDAAPVYEDWDQIVAEVIAMQSGIAAGVTGGGSAGTDVAAANTASLVQKTVLTITDLEVTMVDAAAAGAHGSAPLFTFPAGNIVILGAVGEIGIVAGAGGLADTAAVVAAVGTVVTANDNATLTSTEADIVPSTTATLTDGANAAVNMQSTAVAIKDGTASAGVARLNFAVADAGSSADDTLTVNGTITITWVNLGDN